MYTMKGFLLVYDCKFKISLIKKELRLSAATMSVLSIIRFF